MAGGRVVGDNGAFYFFYERKTRRRTRRYAKSSGQRALDRGLLEAIRSEVREVEGSAVAAGQPYREADLVTRHQRAHGLAKLASRLLKN